MELPGSNEIEQQLSTFLNTIDSLVLATVDGTGIPEASYAAYVEHEGSFYIFVSELASHTQNLRRTKTAGVIFTEKEPGHAFTRKRLTYNCQATVIGRNEPLFEAVLLQMEQQFGNLIITLRGLGDFHLYQLKPTKGQFVAGFGKAYEIDCSQQEIRHRTV